MAKKSYLYDKPRYAFDETHLFSHSHNKEKEETKTFPWWKPAWDDAMQWYFVNPEGKVFDFSLFSRAENLFPEHYKNLEDAQFYEMTSMFFVEWMKKVVYYRSVLLWNTAETRLKAEFPNKRDDQIARMCDDEVAQYFLYLKEGKL